MPAPMEDLGPCEMTWDPDGTPVNLKPFFGGVKLRDSGIVKDIFEDGQGETPVDAVDMGRIVEVESIMTRPNITQLETVIMGSVKSGAGTGTTLKVSNTVGNPLLAQAKELRIKPAVDNAASPDTSEWVHVWKCYPVIDKEIAYDTTGQRVWKVNWKCFPSDETGKINEIYRYGAQV